MIERLELALGRLARIPGESLTPPPYLAYFEETAAFLLKALENEDRPAIRAFLCAKGRRKEEAALRQAAAPTRAGGLYPPCPIKYPASFASPAYAADRLGPDMGPILSAVYAELMAILPCGLYGDEAGMAALLELFLEIYGDFTGEGLPAPEAVRDIFRYYAEDYLPDHLAVRLRERVCPEETPFFRRLFAADLSDPAYLYGLDPFAPKEALALAAGCAALSEETVEELSRTLAEDCQRHVRDKVHRAWRVKTVGLLWPAGAERILRATVHALRDRGLSVTLPRAADRVTLKNDYMSQGAFAGGPCPAFLFDHREDVALFLDDAYVSKHRRAAREAYEAVKQEAGAFGGVFALILPPLSELETLGDRRGAVKRVETAGWAPTEGPTPHALRLTPAQIRLMAGLNASLEDIRSRYEAC